MIYAEIQRTVPTTLAAWEEVEAKFKSNGVNTSGSQAIKTQPKVDYDEFVSLSQQLHRNLAPSTTAASTSPANTADVSTRNGGRSAVGFE